VKAWALERQVRVAERPLDILEEGCELGVVVAYGRLIRPNVLDHLPMVNVHFSLLPRWRGAAPVERAILAGDAEAGVCVMGLEEGLDTGPVFACEATPIGADEHVEPLRDRLAAIGNRLLLAQLALGAEAWSHPVPQEGEATYADKLTVEDLHLDFSRPALDAQRQVRVGRAWTTLRGRRLIIHEAVLAEGLEGAPEPGTVVGDQVATGAGSLRLLVVQAEGRARMDARTWRAGARLEAGERLG
jgi:methionyl-tRNA formyltransferase